MFLLFFILIFFLEAYTLFILVFILIKLFKKKRIPWVVLIINMLVVGIFFI